MKSSKAFSFYVNQISINYYSTRLYYYYLVVNKNLLVYLQHLMYTLAGLDYKYVVRTWFKPCLRFFVLDIKQVSKLKLNVNRPGLDLFSFYTSTRGIHSNKVNLFLTRTPLLGLLFNFYLTNCFTSYTLSNLLSIVSLFVLLRITPYANRFLIRKTQLLHSFLTTSKLL